MERVDFIAVVIRELSAFVCVLFAPRKQDISGENFF
jgi:hypothetical protein